MFRTNTHRAAVRCELVFSPDKATLSQRCAVSRSLLGVRSGTGWADRQGGKLGPFG